MATFKYANEAEIDAAVADVRNDGTETNWVMIAYDNNSNPSTLTLVGSGSGGADELKQQLTNDNCFYSLTRITEMIDNSLTVKFVFMKFLGDAVRPMFKAKLTTHIEEIQKKLRPFHVSLTASSLDEVSQEIFEKLVGEASMSKSREIGAQQAQQSPSASRLHSQQQPSAAASSSVSSGSSASSSSASSFRKDSTLSSSSASSSSPQLQRKSSSATQPTAGGASAAGLVDLATHGEEIRAALQDVRNDATETNWALVTYEEGTNNRLALVGSGSGGVEELKQNLADNKVMYGLVRVQEIIDASVTTKFVFVQWLGTRVSPMFKARISTHKGPVEQLFTQFHVSVFATDLDEISEPIIQELVAKASGTFAWSK